MWFKRIPSILVLLAVLFFASQTMVVGDACARSIPVPIPLGGDGEDNGDPGQGEKLLPDPLIIFTSKSVVAFPTRDLAGDDLTLVFLARPVVSVPTVFAPKVILPGLVFSIDLLSDWNVTR